MKARIVLPLALVLAFGVAASGTAAQTAAPDVSGRWVLDVSLDVGSGQGTFVLQAEGSNLTGTYEGVLGSQQVTGTIEGNTVQFGFESPDAGRITFNGTVEGNTMEGTCDYGLLGAGTFTGTKSN